MSWFNQLNLQENFVFIALGLGAVFIFLFARMVHRDSMGRRQGRQLKSSSQNPNEAKMAKNASFQASDRESTKTVNIPEGKILRGVQFNFSGHAFNAFEALGIQETSDAHEIEKAYQMALDRVDQQSSEFIELAYLTIKNHLQK